MAQGLASFGRWETIFISDISLNMNRLTQKVHQTEPMFTVRWGGGDGTNTLNIQLRGKSLLGPMFSLLSFSLAMWSGINVKPTMA